MIATDNLNLWPLERHDLTKNYQWANDDALCRLSGALPLPKSASELEAWYNNINVDPEVHTFAIKLKDGEYIGNIELRSLDLRCGCAEIGIIIGENRFQGQGFGSEAIISICRFGFEELRLHRLYAQVLEYNPRALAAFKKCGFKEEGSLREAFFRGGRYWDIHNIAILEGEFKAMQSK